MNRMFLALWLILCVGVVAVGYIRLAPSPAGDWHVPLEFASDRTIKGGAMRVFDAPREDFAKLDQIIRGTPNVKVLAGSLKEGRKTFIVRSRVVGFPDYVTIQFDGVQIKVFSRLRYGRSDFGVNAARIDGWLDALKAR